MTPLKNQPALPEVTPDLGKGVAMMTASDYIHDLRQRGFMVYASEQGLYVNPRRDLSEDDKAIIRARKWELIATLHAEELKSTGANWMEMYERQTERLGQTKRELRDAEDRNEMLQMENHWLRQGAALQRNTASELDADLLKKVRFLCHPDRHGGSKLANDVFVELQHITERRGARP